MNEMVTPPPTSSPTSEWPPAKTAEDTGERLRPLYIPKAEALAVKQALAVFQTDYRLSEDTLRRLVKEFRLSNQTKRGAQLRISAPGLAMVLDGDKEALALLRQDNRDHDDVVRYFKRLGIPLK